MEQDVWIVVPVYNEEHTIPEVISELRASFANVLCVDDGSHDHSAVLARRAGAVVVRHPINLGQGAALQTGFDYLLGHTDAEFCVTFDADGQHAVADALRMVARARAEGVDVVLASRFTDSTPDMPWARRRLLKAAVAFTRWTTHLDVSDTHNGLRVLRRSALHKIRLQLPRMAHASELLNAIAPHGLTYVEEPISVVYTDYSLTKGQRNINSVNILFDLAAHRLRFAR